MLNYSVGSLRLLAFSLSYFSLDPSPDTNFFLFYILNIHIQQFIPHDFFQSQLNIRPIKQLTGYI
jgi:hypothetical protein